MRAIVALCRALHIHQRAFHIIACTASDPIFQTSWRQAVIATRQFRALVYEDIEQCIRAASSATGIRFWSIAPSSEFLVRWCLDCRNALADLGCSLPLPDRATYLQVSNKRSFTDFCRNHGLQVPAEGDSPETLGLPCVAKPVVNIASSGRSLYPWLLRTAGDLEKFRANAQPQDYFFQEWIEGSSIYLFFHLGRDGSTMRFSQRNLAQQSGGKSIVLAEAAEFHLSAAAGEWERTLRALGFTGLVMIELRLRQNNEFVLIEANPRLWGPLQLTVDNCPALLTAFFDDVLGPSANGALSQKIQPRKSKYLWLGGALATGQSVYNLDWHVAPPRLPLLSLLRHLRADIFLQRDCWRLFRRELLSGNNSSF